MLMLRQTLSRFGRRERLQTNMRFRILCISLVTLGVSLAHAATPDSTRYLGQAEAATKKGDAMSAVQFYQSAIIYDSRDPKAYVALGDFYAAEKNGELSRKYLLMALEVEPGFAPAIKSLALLDLAEGNEASAKERAELLQSACGARCPETAAVQKAISENKVPPAKILDPNTPAVDPATVPN